jgi:hypothetical protein
MEEECARLFDFSLDCALALPEQQFIWRLHPLMNWDELQARHARWRTLPANVNLSAASLAQDFAASRMVLYRGTTAVMGAVVAGLLPVYLSGRDEMTIDPLWSLKEGRHTVASVDEFRNLAGRAADAGQSEQLQAARDYCRRYYTPLDAKALLACLSIPFEQADANLPGEACQG